MQTVGRFDMWVTPKTNRPSFCLILKLSHALDGLFSVLSRLHGRKHKCAFCWMKDHWVWLLSDIVTWDSFCHGTNYLFSDIDAACDSHFPGFGKYIFPQLQTCTALVLSANCTEDSCLSDIVIFNNFLVFNFSFFNLSNNNFLFPG